MIDARLISALPFWLSLVFVPLLALGAVQGGWWLVLTPLYAFGLISALDMVAGLNATNEDPETPVEHLFWYRLITLIWLPVQVLVIFGALWWVANHDALSGFETLVLFYTIGIATGGVGIVYAHELMHQKSTAERWLADLLMASVLYSHFRSEHLRVHHLWVGTPRDPVSARYNEGFWRYFARVLVACPRSAWQAEGAMLARAGKPAWHRSNPFWRYGLLQAAFLLAAAWLAGWTGVGLFAFQALVAVMYLELTNYIEHYGLTRRMQENGRFEPVKPFHSWNAAHKASNWLLINLQRHSDHHTKPDRRFPLLQNHPSDEAPQLPLGYPAMVVVAMVPPLWRRVMNPRVRQWRNRFYPTVTDWRTSAAKTAPAPPKPS